MSNSESDATSPWSLQTNLRFCSQWSHESVGGKEILTAAVQFSLSLANWIRPRALDGRCSDSHAASRERSDFGFLRLSTQATSSSLPLGGETEVPLIPGQSLSSHSRVLARFAYCGESISSNTVAARAA